MENNTNFEISEVSILDPIIEKFINFQVSIRDNEPMESGQGLFSASEEEIKRFSKDADTLDKILKKDEKVIFDYYYSKSLEYIITSELVVSTQELNAWFKDFINELNSQKMGCIMMAEELQNSLNEPWDWDEIQAEKEKLSILNKEKEPSLNINKKEQNFENKNKENQETKKISTKNLVLLPDIETLKRTCMSVSVLESILNSDGRYYSFNIKSEDPKLKNVQEFYMFDGQGNTLSVFFTDAGVVICGYAKESPMSPWFYERFEEMGFGGPLPGERKKATEYSGKQEFIIKLPDEFKDLIDYSFLDVDLKVYRLTFCIWRMNNDDHWNTGNLPDDQDYSEQFLQILDGKPETYKTWAEDYYYDPDKHWIEGESDENDENADKMPINLKDINYVYQQKPLNNKIVRALNSEITINDISEKIGSFGYPIEN